MKRPSHPLVLAASVILLSVVALAALFFWKHLRGVGPALMQPARDIASLAPAPGSPLALPPGCFLSVFARDLGRPRVLALDPSGTLLVSIPASGTVVALPDRDNDGRADETLTVAEGLNRPHGLAFRCGTPCRLYIAESDLVAVYDYDTRTGKATNRKKIIDLPGGGSHFTRTLLFLPPPDNRLLISVGSSCNACDETDWRRAKVLAANADGTGLKPFAAGLRNAVFMALHPKTRKVWVTEMGRDLLGDDLPPDEINILEEGRNYGWPLCYGKNVQDREHDARLYETNPCDAREMAPSFIDIPAHSAPLGLSFVPDDGGWPEQYRNGLLVAYHGSWNRSVPTGYKIVILSFDDRGNHTGTRDFIAGWLTSDDRSLGRPVDIMVRPNGVAFISDDKAGVIYRLTCKK